MRYPQILGMACTGRRYGRFAREFQDTVTGRLCVVKGPFVPETIDKQFEHEADVLQRLAIQQVVGLRQCFRERKRCWLVFDRLPGCTLSYDVMSCKTTTHHQRVGWLVVRLARTLALCHDRGWIHCDICPANVLVNGSQFWLLDFGAALALGQRYPQRRQVRPIWSSPALLAGEGRVSPADDVYSLLLLACYLLTGLPHRELQRKDFYRSARPVITSRCLSRRQWHFLQQGLEHPGSVTLPDLAVQALGW